MTQSITPNIPSNVFNKLSDEEKNKLKKMHQKYKKLYTQTILMNSDIYVDLPNKKNGKKKPEKINIETYNAGKELKNFINALLTKYDIGSVMREDKKKFEEISKKLDDRGKQIDDDYKKILELEKKRENKKKAIKPLATNDSVSEEINIIYRDIYQDKYGTIPDNDELKRFVLSDFDGYDSDRILYYIDYGYFPEKKISKSEKYKTGKMMREDKKKFEEISKKLDDRGKQIDDDYKKILELEKKIKEKKKKVEERIKSEKKVPKKKKELFLTKQQIEEDSDMINREVNKLNKIDEFLNLHQEKLKKKPDKKKKENEKIPKKKNEEEKKEKTLTPENAIHLKFLLELLKTEKSERVRNAMKEEINKNTPAGTYYF